MFGKNTNKLSKRQSFLYKMYNVLYNKVRKALIFQSGKQNLYTFGVDAPGIFCGGELAKGAQNMLVAVHFVIMEPFFMSSR